MTPSELLAWEAGREAAAKVLRYSEKSLASSDDLLKPPSPTRATTQTRLLDVRAYLSAIESISPPSVPEPPGGAHKCGLCSHPFHGSDACRSYTRMDINYLEDPPPRCGCEGQGEVAALKERARASARDLAPELARTFGRPMPRFDGVAQPFHDRRREQEALREENARLRQALTIIMNGAGSNTTTPDDTHEPHRFGGIYNIARDALSPAGEPGKDVK